MPSSHAPDDSAKTFFLADESATEALGARVGQMLTPGIVIWLTGDLGAGKTTLTRGLLRALGHAGAVKSPTYTLLEPYVVSKMALYHFDFYRFSEPQEFLDAGLEEYFAEDAVCLVEWADKACPFVPPADIEISLQVDGDGRRAVCRGMSERGRACLIRSSSSIPATIRAEPS
jgi:tRNA threonylcarbamoyladenosine biosynthesis protein TsaE